MKIKNILEIFGCPHTVIRLFFLIFFFNINNKLYDAGIYLNVILACVAVKYNVLVVVHV